MKGCQEPFRFNPFAILLKEELEFIDSYLDIEAVRFGPGKLVIEKELDEGTLSTYVPSMIIQPLVENAVKHGISTRLEGGRIIIRARRGIGSAVIEIEDNGTGAPDALVASEAEGHGIGLSNVGERLKVIYGDQCKLELTREPNRGTVARVEIPDIDISYLRAS